jgi:hypothetical protein
MKMGFFIYMQNNMSTDRESAFTWHRNIYVNPGGAKKLNHSAEKHNKCITKKAVESTRALLGPPTLSPMVLLVVYLQQSTCSKMKRAKDKKHDTRR